MKIGLRTKLLVPTLLVIALGIGLSGWYSYRQAADALRGELVDSTEHLLETASLALSSYINNVAGGVKVLSQDESIQKLGSAEAPGEGTRLAANRVLKAMADNFPGIHSMNLAGLDGMTIASARPEQIGTVNVKDREYFQRAAKGEHIISAPFVSTVTGKPMFTIASPVTVNNRVVGVVYAPVDLDAFARSLIEPIHVAKTGYAYVTNKDGLVICHKNEKFVFKFKIGDFDWGRKMLAQDQGSVRYTYDGVTKTVVFTREKLSGWILALTLNDADVSEITAPVWHSSLMFGFVSVLVVGLVIFFIVYRLLGAFKTCVRFAGAISGGDLDSRLNLKRGDEVGELAEALDGMANVVSGLIENVQATAEEIAAGHLRLRLNTAGLEKDFKTLGESLNDLADNVVTMLDAVPSPIMIRDKDRKIRFLNRAGGLGLVEPRAMEGTKCSDLFKAQDCTNGKCACERAYQSKSVVVAHTEVTPTPDMRLEIEYSAIPLSRGAMMEFVVDLTSLKKAQRELLVQAANRLEDVTETMSSASQELSAQIEQSSQGAHSQSDSLGRTAESMREMNASVLEVSDNANQAARIADEAKAKAQDGSSVVTRAIESIGEVQKLSLDLKADMTTLGKQAEGIGAIMNVISDIADQTNLLALNAAIEAARAGDAGRGFAVVADEVRKLAEKTMTATREVGEAISGIQKGTAMNIEHVDLAVHKIDDATGLAGKSGAALREIVELVGQTTDQVRAIALGSRQQAAVTEDFSRTLEEVNRISTETATAMQQSEQAVMELARQAQNLEKLIHDLQKA